MPVSKRVFDLVLLLVLVPVVLPVGLLLALYVRLVSRGPALFSQTRIGHRGRPFVCYKIRSMREGASEADHEEHLKQLLSASEPMTKLDARGDDRLIPGGALLRASGMDELGQLINVVKGEMSLVGPRPCLPYEYSRYSEYHKQRMAVIPGITGWWQVNGKNETTFERMIELDIEYVRRRSLWMDLVIVVRTFFVVARQVFRSIFRLDQRAEGAVVPVSKSSEESSRKPLVEAHADR